MKWRPIESQFHNYYKPWYAAGGRFLTLCAEEIFGEGNAADSPEEVLRQVEEFNALLDVLYGNEEISLW